MDSRLQPDQDVELYYDLMKVKSAKYRVVSVSADRVVYQSSSQVLVASLAWVLDRLVK